VPARTPLSSRNACPASCVTHKRVDVLSVRTCSKRRAEAASSALVGSSSKSTCGPSANPQHTTTRWYSPEGIGSLASNLVRRQDDAYICVLCVSISVYYQIWKLTLNMLVCWTHLQTDCPTSAPGSLILVRVCPRPIQHGELGLLVFR